MCGVALGVRREEFGVGRKQLEINNEELGIGDGVGFIMDFICGVVERYAGDFYMQFLCVMSGIYWHLTRRGAHCAPAKLNRQYFFQWSRIGQTAMGRCSSSSPYR